MKKNFTKPINLIFLIFTFVQVVHADDVVIMTPATDMTEELDLHAVAEIFKNSENLESFEQTINSPDTGINNLDIDGNGEVDFIRVVEEVSEQTHIIILQATLGENQFQDVATIEIEKENKADTYNIQVRGNAYLYGPSYYIAPTNVGIYTWPVIAWIYRPHYRPYRSSYFFGRYPRWWRTYRPVSSRVYRNRTVKLTRNNTFIRSKTTRVHTAAKVKYKPRRTSLVKKRKVVTRKTVVKKENRKIRKTTKTTNRKKKKRR